MKNKDIRSKTEKELKILLEESQKKLRELRFSFKAGKVKNNQAIKFLKRNIAKILTILNELKVL